MREAQPEHRSPERARDTADATSLPRASLPRWHRPSCEAVTPPPPKFEPVLKICPIDGTPFRARISMHHLRIGLSSSKMGVRTIFCSQACARVFARTIGGDPFLHSFGVPEPPSCRTCASALSPATIKRGKHYCRACQVTAAVIRAVKTRAKHDARLAKTLAAEKLASDRERLRRNPPPPMEYAD